MTQLKYTGGARIGFSRATWPFASLTVTKESLNLNAFITGNLSFTKDDIISIKPHFGVFGIGLKIEHKVPEYNKKVIFLTFNAQSIINDIKNIGFLDKITSIVSEKLRNEIKEKQKYGGFPLKTSFGIAVVIIWNLLFFIDIKTSFIDSSEGFPTGRILALTFVLIVSILILISKDFRHLALNKGKELKDINVFLFFLMFICIIILVGTIALIPIKKTNNKYKPEILKTSLLESDYKNDIAPLKNDKKFEVKATTFREVKINDSESVITISRTEQGQYPVIYGVQILASRKVIPLNSTEFKDLKLKVEQLYKPEHPKYKYKYVVGNESSLSKAQKLKKELENFGFSSAFIVKR